MLVCGHCNWRITTGPLDEGSLPEMSNQSSSLPMKANYSRKLFFRKVYRIHPSFRIVGLAEPPQINSSQNQWLNSELLPLFLYHHIEPLKKSEEAEIIFKMVRSFFRRYTLE
jgi:hypothetical protein